MERKIEQRLLKWKNTRFQALLVKGARQIGKTYSIETFLNKEYKVVKEVNFANNATALEAFSNLKNYEDFEVKLALIFGDVTNDDKSVVFFDEIQLIYRRRDEMVKRDPKSCDGTVDIVTLIKDVASKDKRRYIISGSLLGVNMEGVLLSPAGYMDVIKMYPMDFEEFLWAKGISKILIAELRKNFEECVSVDKTIHEEMLSLFREYVLIGGMPEAVKKYIKNSDFGEVTLAQEQILGYYHRDIVTYTSIDERLAVQEVFDTIPSEIDAKNKRFIKTKLDLVNVKNLDLSDRFLWLDKAGVVLPVYNVADVTYPLRITEQRKTLKLFLSDVGLLSCLLLGEEGRKKMLLGDIKVNYGAPFENVVAQELSAHGFAPLHYWNNKKSGEIDFVVEDNNEILPLEIKSGKSNGDSLYNHRALNNCLEGHKKIKKALVFSSENTFKETKTIINYPIYFISFLKNDKPNPFDD